jgi:hypothetical protein
VLGALISASCNASASRRLSAPSGGLVVDAVLYARGQRGVVQVDQVQGAFIF